MMLAEPLLVGDRVRMTRNVQGIMKDSYGRVVRVLPTMNCYDIRFEHYPWPRLVYHGDLELVERKREVGLL